jgi:pimeloyl-ACP methyl ester carboxylesterase
MLIFDLHHIGQEVMADRLADTIPGSRLGRLPGTGRLVPEEAPETLANMILEFVGAAGTIARAD